EDPHSEHDLARGALNRRSFVAAGTAAMSTLAAVQSRSAAAASLATTSTHAPFWPNGARLAVTLSMVIENGGDPPPATKGPDGKSYPDLYATTALQYTVNEAIPRMLDMFDRKKIKVSSMMVGKFCELHPDLAKEIVERGHEGAAHGYTHSNQYNMSRDDEHAFIQSAVDAITKATGQRPLGYNGRGQLRSANTLSIEQELGFIYHIDDISRDEPFVVPVNDKPFAVVPYTQHLGDIGYFNNRGSAVAFNGEMKYEFDALYAEAETKRRMMVVTIHDSIARASRVKAFEDFIAYAQSHKGVWFARADELAHWALGSPDSIKEKIAT
ncbi:MAG TPA: polysaccharide deacetylase family protein, partial [Beijerinckiaceae bacterium]|nr:polysaccharide deacetylase family protein [Beijerinckiaceae bacterium]